MPESARWLIANGKLLKAQIYLQKCAKMNKTDELTDTLKTEVSILQIINRLLELSNNNNNNNGINVCLVFYANIFTRPSGFLVFLKA